MKRSVTIVWTLLACRYPMARGRLEEYGTVKTCRRPQRVVSKKNILGQRQMVRIGPGGTGNSPRLMSTSTCKSTSFLDEDYRLSQLYVRCTQITRTFGRSRPWIWIGTVNDLLLLRQLRPEVFFFRVCSNPPVRDRSPHWSQVHNGPMPAWAAAVSRGRNLPVDLQG